MKPHEPEEFLTLRLAHRVHELRAVLMRALGGKLFCGCARLGEGSDDV